MQVLSRRSFGKETLGSLLTFSLLETCFTRDAFGEEIKPIAAKWLARVNQMSVDLRGEKIKQTDWQDQVEQLSSQIELAEMLKFLDFEKLTADIPFRDKGERALRAKFPEVEGLPTRLVFGHQVFALKEGRSVVPHGHDNMATSFLILQGDFHGRHFDRLEDEPEHMIIKPTIDRAFAPGEFSTISDHRDNVHWFTATTEKAFIFNIHVLNVDPSVKKNGRVYIDPQGEKLADGRIRAARLNAREAWNKYG
ncbi:MAG: hypothetical protein KDA42_04895 [Planctomycetales bacterium]|nr:hypothetical protein [Planctomycetales bacterium]